MKPQWENSLKEPEAGGLFVAHTTQELGIDRRGQGKLKKHMTVAGAAYLVMSIGVSESLEIRFIRIEDE